MRLEASSSSCETARCHAVAGLHWWLCTQCCVAVHRQEAATITSGFSHSCRPPRRLQDSHSQGNSRQRSPCCWDMIPLLPSSSSYVTRVVSNWCCVLTRTATQEPGLGKARLLDREIADWVSVLPRRRDTASDWELADTGTELHDVSAAEYLVRARGGRHALPPLHRLPSARAVLDSARGCLSHSGKELRCRV